MKKFWVVVSPKSHKVSNAIFAKREDADEVLDDYVGEVRRVFPELCTATYAAIQDPKGPANMAAPDGTVHSVVMWKWKEVNEELARQILVSNIASRFGGGHQHKCDSCGKVFAGAGFTCYCHEDLRRAEYCSDGCWRND